MFDLSPGPPGTDPHLPGGVAGCWECGPLDVSTCTLTHTRRGLGLSLPFSIYLIPPTPPPETPVPFSPQKPGDLLFSFHPALGSTRRVEQRGL